MNAASPNGDERVLREDLVRRAKEMPMRGSILDLLTIDFMRSMGPRDMSYELQTDVRRVVYHLMILQMTGLLENAGEALNREGYERFFRLIEPRPPSAAP